MSDKATLRRLMRQISDAKRTEEIIIAEEAIVKLFDAVRDQSANMAQKEECHWHQEDSDWGLWVGECGAEWEFIDDGPVENDVHFCPNCGRKLIVVEEGGEG